MTQARSLAIPVWSAVACHRFGIRPSSAPSALEPQQGSVLQPSNGLGREADLPLAFVAFVTFVVDPRVVQGPNACPNFGKPGYP